MCKKVLAGLLAITMVLGGSVLPADLSCGSDGAMISAGAETYGDYEYAVLEDGTAEITAYSGKDENLIVPDTIDGKTVTRIGGAAFDGHIGLISVKIPKSVTSIGSGVSDSGVGNGIFGLCSKLESITVDEENETYSSEDGALYNKDKTELLCCPCAKAQFAFPESVVKIGGGAFVNCEGLTDIVVPDRVSEIGISTFAGCKNLESVQLPETIKEIPSGMFYNCGKLKKVNVPDGITRIGDYAFTACESLKDISIPDSVEYIGEQALICSKDISEITVPKGTSYIGEMALGYYYENNESHKNESFKINCYMNTEGRKYARSNEFAYKILDMEVPAVTMTTFSSTADAVRINWDEVSGASGYRIYRYNPSIRKWQSLASIKDGSVTTYRDSRVLSAGTVYKYKVKAYVEESGVNYWGNYSDVFSTATRPEAVKLTKSSSAKTAVRVYWNKVNCTGYKLQQYDPVTKKWITIKLLSSDKTNYRISGLKNNTSYKFRIRAYRTSDTRKAFTAWSSVKTVRTKK